MLQEAGRKVRPKDKEVCYNLKKLSTESVSKQRVIEAEEKKKGAREEEKMQVD